MVEISAQDLRQSFLLHISEELTNEWSRKIHAEDLQKHANVSNVWKLEFKGIIFYHFNVEMSPCCLQQHEQQRVEWTLGTPSRKTQQYRSILPAPLFKDKFVLRSGLL